jgi:hypothetical protein
MIKYRLIVILIICFFINSIYSQVLKRDVYSIINEIGIEEFPNKKHVKYYLCQEPFPTIIYIDSYKKQIYDSLTLFFTKNEIDSILLEEKITQKSFLWDKEKIKFTMVVSKEEELTINEIKKHSLKKKIYNEFLSFTYPRFSKNGDYFFLLINQSDKEEGSSTWIYLFHFISGKWKKEKLIMGSTA